MKDIHFDSKGMTNDCPLTRDRSSLECTLCHHFIIMNSNFTTICGFPGDRGRPRTWFYKLNQWVDDDSVTYKVLEMHLPTPGAIVPLRADEVGIAFSARYVEDAITKARDLARQYHCKFLDINCPKGSGGRKIIVLK